MPFGSAFSTYRLKKMLWMKFHPSTIPCWLCNTWFSPVPISVCSLSIKNWACSFGQKLKSSWPTISSFSKPVISSAALFHSIYLVSFASLTNTMFGKFSIIKFFNVSNSFTLFCAILRCVMSRITSTVPFTFSEPVIRESEKSNQCPSSFIFNSKPVNSLLLTIAWHTGQFSLFKFSGWKISWEFFPIISVQPRWDKIHALLLAWRIMPLSSITTVASGTASYVLAPRDITIKGSCSVVLIIAWKISQKEKSLKICPTMLDKP